MSVLITPELLADLKATAEIAEQFSPSPWESFEDDDWYSICDANGSMVCNECSDEEAEHIAAADPGMVLALVAEVERLRAELARAKGGQE